jgi:hypothetical protein
MSPIDEMPGSAFNTQILITTLITVLSVLIGMYIGRNLSSEKSRQSPKMIVRSPDHIAYVLLKAQEGSEKYSEEDYANLINTLIELLDEQNHPDVDILYYIASEVFNKRHPSQVYEVWLTLAYRRLAVTPNERLPEAWFVEPVTSHKVSDLDISDISESSTDDEFQNEAGALISPILSNPNFEESDLNAARIYTAQSNLVDLDISLPAEVGLPQHLDMSAID